MTTIPASQLVSVVPSVLAAGGNAFSTTGLILTNNPEAPIGSVLSFSGLTAVNQYFGSSSAIAALAAIYFGGFIGASAIPGTLFIAQYPLTAVGAYLRGANISKVTLATLQSYSGLLSVTVNGVLASANINLAAATSFSNAAQIIGSALNIQGPQVGAVTGSISGNTLTVTAVSSGVLAVGNVVNGTGVTANTYISALASGTGGVGTYTVSVSQTAANESMTINAPGVYFDSIQSAFTVNSSTTGSGSIITYGSGALAGNLLLTQALGAVLSQGAAALTASTVAAYMNNLVQVNMAWSTFMTDFDPDGGSGNTFKQALAAWKNTQSNRFAYICWDPDPVPAVTNPDPSGLGVILAGNNDSGTGLIWATAPSLAAFICGAAAAINFNQNAGRITFAYKAQAGLVANVSDLLTSGNLQGNGYNFYGAYGAANGNSVWFQTGVVTGAFKWLDSYINQIWLNNQFQAALLNLLGNAKSIPYSAAGNSMIEQALASVIQAGLSFGAYAPGAISATQIAQVNAAAGAVVSNILQAQGWYLQIQQASSQVRAARGTPPMTFWYLDRGSVQQMTLNSIAVQ